jgi:hypothetical protein
MHRLDNVVFLDCQEDDNLEFYSKNDYLESIFNKVFSELHDNNGVLLGNRAIFKHSYINVLEKCNIENSMNIIYKLLNRHLESQESSYFKDDGENLPSGDVLKVIELLNILHVNKVPKRFVAGFLLLMVKFVYFPSVSA